MSEANSDARARHWTKTRNLTILVLVIWAIFAFLLPWNAKSLNEITFIGFPLGYYFTVQGSLIVFVLLIFFQNWRQDAIDDEAGRDALDVVLGQCVIRIHHGHAEGVGVLGQPLGDLRLFLVAGGQEHHLAGTAQFLVQCLDVGHLHAAGRAPGGPEIEEDHLAPIVGELELVAFQIDIC